MKILIATMGCVVSIVERVDFTSSALELIGGTFILLYLLCHEALAFKTFRPVCM